LLLPTIATIPAQRPVARGAHRHERTRPDNSTRAGAGEQSTDFQLASSDHQCPVDDWQIDSTSKHVAMRISAKRPCDFTPAAGEHGFRLEVEQARQLIRDLSRAVLASDLQRKVQTDGEQRQPRRESLPEVQF
jgi:hypothetical protein